MERGVLCITVEHRYQACAHHLREKPMTSAMKMAALAAAVYQARGINPNLQSESLGGYSYTTIAEKTFHQLDLVSRHGLYLWRSSRISKYKVTV